MIVRRLWFTIRNLRENVQEVEDGRRLVTDAEGNRFLLPTPTPSIPPGGG